VPPVYRGPPYPAPVSFVRQVQVTVNSCASGLPIAGFLALHKYELGGNGQVVPATNPTGLSAHMMIWNHVSNIDEQMSMKMLRFDGPGNPIGWIALTSEISINEAADEYAESGMAEAMIRVYAGPG
jgi:hypothetical protein